MKDNTTITNAIEIMKNGWKFADLRTNVDGDVVICSDYDAFTYLGNVGVEAPGTLELLEWLDKPYDKYTGLTQREQEFIWSYEEYVLDEEVEYIRLLEKGDKRILILNPHKAQHIDIEIKSSNSFKGIRPGKIYSADSLINQEYESVT